MVFELATGDLLFDPRSGKDYDRSAGMLPCVRLLLFLLTPPDPTDPSHVQAVVRYGSHQLLDHLREVPVLL